MFPRTEIFSKRRKICPPPNLFGRSAQWSRADRARGPLQRHCDWFITSSAQQRWESCALIRHSRCVLNDLSSMFVYYCLLTFIEKLFMPNFVYKNPTKIKKIKSVEREPFDIMLGVSNRGTNPWGLFASRVSVFIFYFGWDVKMALLELVGLF